ncbi:MAG: thioredoxin family protein [Calditrichaeota bacterium]|nr:thioredoxin family protein [Calditrichota bacterium]
MVNEERFLSGKSYHNFLQDADEYAELYEHHYKRTLITERDSQLLKKLGKLNILVLTEIKCPDSVTVLPVLQKWSESHDGIKMRILERDENLEIMDNYLTNGGRAIPKLIFYNRTFQEIGNWGPRPAEIQAFYEKQREQIKAGKTDKMDIHKKMRQMYAKERGRSIIREISALLENNPVLKNEG